MAAIKRQHMSMIVKLKACLHVLGMTLEDTDFHHEPPLSHRPIDLLTGDTIPSQNDPKHIVPMLREHHRARTTGDSRPLSGDTSIAAKLKRNAKAEAEFRDKILRKAPGTPRPKKSRIPSRPFQQRKKK